MTDNLAQFTDRYTMRHERTYPHPIDRVWRAVTTPEHMDRWMLPFNTVEPWLGGAFSMTFGGPADEPLTGQVAAWDPPKVVEYRFGPGNDTGMRFELAEVAGGTHLTFIHAFPPSTHGTPMAGPGGDLPGADDTPWRPGFVAGFHLQMDNLRAFLDGTLPSEEEMAASRERHHKGEWATDWLDLIEVYTQHIIATIPD